MLALELNERVVAAAAPVGVLPADSRPCFIDRAAAFGRVEESADRTVDRIFLMPEDSFGLAVVVVNTRVAARSDLGRDTKVSGQALKVALFHLDPRIAATVTGTLRTVILDLLCRGAHAVTRLVGRLGSSGRAV